MTTPDDRPVSPPRILRAVNTPKKKGPPKKGPGPGAGPTLEERIAVSERRAQAWALKLAGADNVSIGRALTRQGGPNRAPTPHGYDGTMEDGPLADTVRADLEQALKDRKDTTAETATAARAMMIQRHYLALRSLWPAMTRGDVKAHMAGLGHMRAIAKLGGLDAPTRIAVDKDNPDVLETTAKILHLLKTAADDDPGMTADGPS